MVKLKRISISPVEEKFDGSQGKLWKSGTRGTATMFANWVSSVINANTVKNSAVKTRREYVTQEGVFETLNISYGKKDILPLDIRVRVPQEGKSVINLRYRNNPKAAIWVEKDYIINDPLSLSVDPTTKKLISVAFSGPQFSFAGQGRKLNSIPGYEHALSELEKPILRAAKILDNYDSEMYKSRNLDDFEHLPEVYELKDLYKNWSIDIDTSKLASSNKVIYLFNHPTDPDFSFTVSIQDEGGSEYKIYATYRNQEMSLAKLAKSLKNEIERLSTIDLTKTTQVSNKNKDDKITASLLKGKDLDDIERFLKSLGHSVSWDFSHIRETSPYIIGKDRDSELSVIINKDGMKIYSDEGVFNTLDDYFTYKTHTQESRELKKEMKVSGTSSISMLDDPKKLDDFVKKIGDALEDFSLARWANIDITQNDDGTEDWDLILTTQHNKKSNSPDGIISWRIDPKRPLQFYKKDKDIFDNPKTTVTYEDKIAALDMKTNFGYTPSIRDVELNSPAFFNEITKAAEKFLEEFGAYNRTLATVSDIDDQIIGGKDWITSYDKPDYNLANWADRTLGKIEPELERLQNEYNMSLEKKVEEIETDNYADFLSQYGVVGDKQKEDKTRDMFSRDMSGKLVFTGSYVDKSFTDHLLELRVNFDRGDKFVVWIRPDLKGTDKTKAVGQSDLSFLREWAKENVSLRTAQKNSDNYRQAISQELINLGAIEGKVKGTFDISTSKIKDITIDLKVTNNQIIVNAYRDGKMVDTITMDIAPFKENPVKVAKNILSLLSKHIKESYPSVDRCMPLINNYWNALFDKLKLESSIKKESCFNNHYLIVDNKKCKVEFGSLGQVKLLTMTGKEVVEEQFNADPRYFKEDKHKMKVFLEDNRFKF